MKEIKSIINLYELQKDQSQRCAIAQVIRVEESSYRREGARMIVFESGIFEGGISGGCLEGDALKRSQMAILREKPSIVTYDTSKDDENQIGVGLGCNGVIDVLISPITEKNDAISILKRCLEKRQSHILVTVTSTDEVNPEISLGQTYYYDTQTNILEGLDHGELKERLLADIATVLERKKSRIYSYEIEGKEVRAFIELIPPQYHLVIMGDNYDIYPMIDLAKVMDWEVSLIGKLQKLKKERLASVQHLFDKQDDRAPNIDARTAVILMAHDYKTDLRNLQKMLQTPTPYIASLGPKKRFNKMEKELIEKGTPLTEQDLARIYAPCGLEIGANTPEEIAASIFTEILSVFSGKQGGMLREKVGPIHERV